MTQRNKLLKELTFRPDYEETLDIWDMQLVSYGREVISYRKEFIDQLNDLIQDVHFNLSGERERLRIFYDPNVEREEFETALKKSRAQDIKQRTTLTGPHREMCIRDRLISTVSSAV